MGGCRGQEETKEGVSGLSGMSRRATPFKHITHFPPFDVSLHWASIFVYKFPIHFSHWDDCTDNEADSETSA